MYDLIVIGGGAAGIFSAIQAKNSSPSSSVLVLEKSAVLLSKVKISGGGRCNVTHACYDPSLLTKHYPRGTKELIGPFHRFQPKDTFAWFESRGIPLKIEADGRCFPASNRSESIIACLLSEAEKLGVEIKVRENVSSIYRKNDHFRIDLKEDAVYETKKLLLATGSSDAGHKWAAALGHTIQSPVPSLFTFNSPTSLLKEMSGVSVDPVTIRIKDTPFLQTGPLLITHFGFSGPAVLKLSAWGARYLFEHKYCHEIIINWLPEWSKEDICKKLKTEKKPFSLPKKLWRLFLEMYALENKRPIEFSAKDIHLLCSKLQSDCYKIEGKTTHKEEFVTCGGITLKEVNFKTMESKVCKGLFFAGEILDIDGVTGGFNFQNAWTTGFIAGISALKNESSLNGSPDNFWQHSLKD